MKSGPAVTVYYRNSLTLFQVSFHAVFVFDDVDDIYWAHELLLADDISEHAPIKKMDSKMRKPVFVNGNLRRTILMKKMFFF